MNIISSFKEKVRGKGISVAFPEGNDERIIQAARILKDQDIAQPIVLGKPDQIQAAIETAGVTLDDIKTINPRESDKLDAYVEKYIEARHDVSAGMARRILAKPLFYAAMMVACDDADTAIGGVASATATVIQAATLTVGLAPGVKTPSSYLLMVIPGFLGAKNKPFIYADCGVNIDPTAEQLADIALTSAASAARILDEEPRVALLSFSTKGSASSPSVDKVKKALEIARSRRPELAIDGEFQADSAIVPRVAAKKVKPALIFDKKTRAVAGKANVLIFNRDRNQSQRSVISFNDQFANTHFLILL